MELTKFYGKLVKLIEETVKRSGGRPMVIIAHSYANVILNHLYQHYVDQVSVAFPFFSFVCHLVNFFC
jgi:predicted alpha/beta hydrolase family esterase